jgi:decaprenylphospho-beta-D-erythro-pentofuranosid-2-ulose 2-reductase
MHLLILGANSDVAYAVAQKFAAMKKAHLYLASRDLDILEKRAQGLRIRYEVGATVLPFDATAYHTHAMFYESLAPKPDGVVLSFGYLGAQAKAQVDFGEAAKIIAINFLGAVSILEVVARDFEARGHGFIIGISSVAGERGRQSNYLYGAAKAGLTVFLSGLRNRLAKQQVRVITVLPGFVLTKMTEHLEFPGMLSAQPEEVAADIYRAYHKGKDIIYTKGLWRWIMAVIKMIPETVFKRLKL